MVRRHVGSGRWWCAAVAAGLGLPVLVLVWPVEVVAFVPVVAVEAVVARRVAVPLFLARSGSSGGACNLSGSAAANPPEGCGRLEERCG